MRKLTEFDSERVKFALIDVNIFNQQNEDSLRRNNSTDYRQIQGTCKTRSSKVDRQARRQKIEDVLQREL